MWAAERKHAYTSYGKKKDQQQRPPDQKKNERKKTAHKEMRCIRNEF